MVKIRRDNGSALVGDVSIGEEAPGNRIWAADIQGDEGVVVVSAERGG
jgi:hypothetical protein